MLSYFLSVIRVDDGCYCIILNSDRANKCMLFWRNSIIKPNEFCCGRVFNDNKAVGNMSYFIPVIRVDDRCYFVVGENPIKFLDRQWVKYFARIVELLEHRRRQNCFRWAKWYQRSEMKGVNLMIAAWEIWTSVYIYFPLRDISAIWSSVRDDFNLSIYENYF